MTTNKKETMMLWSCVKCTAKRAAELLHCPHCGEAEYQEAPGGVVESGAPILNAVAAPAEEPAAPKPKATKKAATDTAVETTSAADAPPAAS